MADLTNKVSISIGDVRVDVPVDVERDVVLVAALVVALVVARYAVAPDALAADDSPGPDCDAPAAQDYGSPAAQDYD